MENNNVSLTISKEIVTPIVKEKINLMVIEALGGQIDLIEKVVDVIVNSKVDSTGKVSSYNSDNKFNWLDIVLTEQIKKAVKEEIINEITKSSEVIKNAVREILKTKKGQNAIAAALVDGVVGSFKDSWRSSFAVKFEPYSK